MEIKTVLTKEKCDSVGCKEDAKYSVQIKKSLLGGNLCLCENCMRELYASVGKILIPKSPENIIKKKTEVKK